MPWLCPWLGRQTEGSFLFPSLVPLTRADGRFLEAEPSGASFADPEGGDFSFRGEKMGSWGVLGAEPVTTSSPLRSALRRLGLPYPGRFQIFGLICKAELGREGIRWRLEWNQGLGRVLSNRHLALDRR